MNALSGVTNERCSAALRQVLRFKDAAMASRWQRTCGTCDRLGIRTLYLPYQK